MLGIEFQDTVTLGAIITAGLVLLIAGVPVSLIRRLREERDAEREAREKLEKELADCKRELTETRAKTDLSAAIDRWELMHEATLSHLEKLEAATAGGFASFTRSQERMAVILDRLESKLELAQ